MNSPAVTMHPPGILLSCGYSVKEGPNLELHLLEVDPEKGEG
jgi:hypothetical protein